MVKDLVCFYRSNFHATNASALLLLLLAADFAFIFLYVLLKAGVLSDELFRLGKPQSYSEYFQYFKEFSIFALLLAITARTREIGYIAWSLLFFYLLLDDALEMHEQLGEYLSGRLGLLPAFGLRPRDFGELAVSALAAALFLTSLAMFYVVGSGVFRQATKHLLLLLLALSFFGVFVDMLHVSVDAGRLVSFLLSIAEEGGEMVVMSIMAWFVFLLRIRDGAIGVSLRKMLDPSVEGRPIGGP